MLKGGKLYRYYVNTQAAKESWDSCTTTSLPAAKIENFYPRAGAAD